MALRNWPSYLQGLEKAGELWARTWSPDDDLVRAELYRQIMMNLSVGYFIYFQSDADYPDLAPFFNSVFACQPNPDDTYYFATIRGSGTYRISGDRGSVKLLTLTIGRNMPGMADVMSPQFLEQDLDELPRGKDGAVDLILSTERPAGYEGAWLPLHPDADWILIRQRCYDWGNEADARLALQLLDPMPLRPRLSDEQISDRLDKLMVFAERYSRFWLDLMNTFKNQHAPNVIHEAPYAQMGGVRKQVYWQAIFELDDDEALILEADVPDNIPYWNVQLNDELFNVLEFVYRQSSLNGHQAHVGKDGRFIAVISKEDPGVANWLDVAGHNKGTVIGRWYGSGSGPMPALRRVKLSDVLANLPADMPRVTAEGRREALARRVRGAQLRRRW